MTASILVIDDDPDSRELLAMLLSRASYRVSCAADAMDGLAQFGRGDFDLVISDVMMPEVTGYELCRRIRAAEEYTPLLIVSALGRPDDRAQGYAAGADGFLTKPIFPQELLARVRAALDMKGRQDRLRSQAVEAREAGAFQRRIVQPGRLPDGLAVRVKPLGQSGGDLVRVHAREGAGDAGPEGAVPGWTVFLSDSSGHDLTAGLSAVAVRALLAGLDRVGDPGRALGKLNRALCQVLTPNHFVTAFLAVWDGRRLTYAHAGHPAPLVRRRGRVGAVRTVPTFPLGIQPGAEYPTRRLSLAAGDRLLVYSDGLSETEGPEGLAYGTSAVQRILRDAAGPEEAADRILADMEAFRGGRPVEDDVSLVVAEI